MISVSDVGNKWATFTILKRLLKSFCFSNKWMSLIYGILSYCIITIFFSEIKTLIRTHITHTYKISYIRSFYHSNILTFIHYNSHEYYYIWSKKNFLFHFLLFFLLFSFVKSQVAISFLCFVCLMVFFSFSCSSIR